MRSVLVLTIGALDSYLSDLVIETIPKMAKETRVRGVFDRLAKARPGLILRAFFVGREELDEELAEVIEAEFAGDSMHGSGAVMKVSDWCNLGLGRDAYNSDDFPNALKTLDEWTGKRHRIVHRGEQVRLRRTDASDIIVLVRAVGQTLNDQLIKIYG